MKAIVKRGIPNGYFGISNELDNFFNGFFDDIPVERKLNQVEAFSPKLNVKDTKKEIQISAEIPGVDEKDIKIELEDDRVIISGEKKTEKKEEGDNWVHTEQSFGSFTRTIPLTTKIDDENVKAKFKNGVLNITLPKSKEEKEKKKLIAIE